MARLLMRRSENTNGPALPNGFKVNHPLGSCAGTLAPQQVALFGEAVEPSGGGPGSSEGGYSSLQVPS